MRRYARYRLIHADAFEWLSSRPANSFHAVVTDPPFAVIEYTATELSKRRKRSGGIWRLPQSYDGQSRSPMPRFTVLRASDIAAVSQFHARLAPLLLRLLAPGGHIFMASQPLISHIVASRFVDCGFELRGQIIRVVKTLRGGDRPKHGHNSFPDVSVIPRASWEPWLIFRKPCEGTVKQNLRKWGTGALRRPSRDKPFRDIIAAGPPRGTERKVAPHPSLKPQVLLRQLVRASLPLGKGVLLDPFMGSGSTIAAASLVGLVSIGIETDARFFNMARKAIPKLRGLPDPNESDIYANGRSRR